MPEDTDAGRDRTSLSLPAILFRVLLLAAIIVAANYAVLTILQNIPFHMPPPSEPMVRRLLLTTAVFYAVILAVPFVPGAEIGVALLSMFGPRVVPLVYFATLAGLTLAFCIGRLVSPSVAGAWCRRMRLTRLAVQLERFAAAEREGRKSELVELAEGRMSRFLVRHRFLALALALNLPGNVVIGGGGGLAFMAGISRLYSWPGFLCTITLAVAPVPLVVLVFGISPF